MATHSGVLAWRIPWTEEPGGLQPRGSQRVRKTTEGIQHPCIHANLILKIKCWGFPGDSVVKNPPANAGDTSSVPDPGGFHVARSN